MLKLSIIVPVYNVEAYLSKCLDSLINNNLLAEEYEIIIIDDGSTDNSGKKADNYSQEYSNINVVHQANKGLGGARNTGIQMARGTYIMFVDSDDYVEPKTFKALLDKSINQDLDVLRFDHEEVDTNHEIIPKKKNATRAVVFRDDVINGKKYLSKRMGYACYVCIYLFKRNFIVDGGYLFKEHIYFEDVEWLPRVLVNALRVGSDNTHVYNYLKRSESITKSLEKEKAAKRYADQGLIVDHINRLIREEQNPGVIKWAMGLIALTTISRLSFVARHLKHKQGDALRELREKKIRPLRPYSFTIYQCLWARLINLSPKLFILVKRHARI